MDKVYAVLEAEEWENSFILVVCKSQAVAEAIAARRNAARGDDTDGYYYWVQEQRFNGEDA